MENPSPLTKSNVVSLNGKYSINASNEEEKTRKYWMYNNFLQELDRKLLADTFKIDSAKTYAVRLEVLANDKLKIDYIENGETIRERILNAKLKKDGYLYLKNKNVGLVLVPYVAGAIDIKKTRLSKTEDGELIFDVANHRSGAFMIIAFLDGRTWKYRKIYPKVI
ncbi:hypothetical protein EZ428_23165 [Pedobacter frigiditerrae]|uniref:Uncharacterized protein n=1 Tax=Pedobacter frigiditerrae TaxID=2530452 RepID=A0A4R0MJM5_9SPHI|nr:hypothetical protein [Pedobacter frigiditerrae]TCC86613.1 hypothetical protein EZ428_23165 [Pedobacter frigiditerrae]